MTYQIRDNYRISQTDVEIINICNLKCPYCRGSNGKEEILPNQSVYSILENIAGWGIPAIIFNGGEPSLRKKDLIEFANIAFSLGVRPGMYSNGTLIDQKFAEGIAGIDNYRAVISVHSLNPKKDLNKTYNGIAQLNAVGVIPEIFLLMTSRNVGNLERLIEDISRNKVSKVSLLQFGPVGVGYGHEQFVLSYGDRATIHRKVEALKNNISFELNCTIDLDKEKALDKLRNAEPPKKFTLHINSDGMIVPFYAGAEDTVIGKANDKKDFIRVVSNPSTYEFFEKAMCAFIKRVFGSIEKTTPKITKREIEMQEV